jgi:radical SAM superfamily enzyme YgiQ (UPF0313 family)
MRVLLIQPNFPRDYRYGPKDSIIFPPLGLECLAGNILDIANTRIFDGRIYKINKLRHELENFKPDYVGISCNFSTQIYHVNFLASIAKKYGAKTVIGGWHPTLVPDETVNFPWNDIIIRSEGEITFRELIEKDSPVGVKGISYKNNGKIIHNPKRELGDFNKILPPARNLRDPKARLRYNFFGIPADIMETSRGCPFRCKFCSVHEFYKKQYRIKNTKNIIKELRTIKEYCKYVYIIDDNFMVYPRHITNLCDGIIRDHLDMFFMTTARVDMVTKHPEIFEKMAKAGFFFLFMGLEAFSNSTLANLNKKFKFDKIKKGVKILHDMGFLIQGNVILGANLDDTERDLESTIQIMKSLEIDFPTYSLLTPYPCTELRAEVEEKNMLLDCTWKDFTWYNPTIKYPNLTAEQLMKYIDRAHSETKFFNNPPKIISRTLKARGLGFFLSRIARYKFIKDFIPSFKNFIIQAMNRKSTEN